MILTSQAEPLGSRLLVQHGPVRTPLICCSETGETRQVFHIQLMKLAYTSLAEKQVWDRFDDFVNVLQDMEVPAHSS